MGRGGEREAGRGEEKRSWAAGWFVELGWVDFGSLGWFDSSFFSSSSISFPFLFLIQTKLNLFEFKFEFEFKPHSIK